MLYTPEFFWLLPGTWCSSQGAPGFAPGSPLRGSPPVFCQGGSPLSLPLPSRSFLVLVTRDTGLLVGTVVPVVQLQSNQEHQGLVGGAFSAFGPSLTTPLQVSFLSIPQVAPFGFPCSGRSRACVLGGSCPSLEVLSGSSLGSMPLHLHLLGSQWKRAGERQTF